MTDVTHHGPGWDYAKAEVEEWLSKTRLMLDKKLPDEHPLADLAKRALNLYDELVLSDAENSLLIMAGTLANDLKQLVDSTSAGKPHE
jgi:hypothetical protein